MASIRDHANGWACVDCLMLLANGETPPEMTEDETTEYLARVDAGCSGSSLVTLGRLYGEEHGCEHTNDDDDDHYQCETLDFSMSHCDVCGSRLGGSRHAVTFWLD